MPEVETTGRQLELPFTDTSTASPARVGWTPPADPADELVLSRPEPNGDKDRYTDLFRVDL